MSEFAALFAAAKQKALDKARAEAKSEMRDSTSNSDEVVRDFRERSGKGVEIKDKIETNIKEKPNTVAIDLGNNIKGDINSSLLNNLDNVLQRNSSTSSIKSNSSSNRKIEMLDKSEESKLKDIGSSKPVTSIITAPPSKKEILDHFLRNKEKYAIQCSIPIHLFSRESVDQTLREYLVKNSIKLGNKALTEISILYHAFSKLDMDSRKYVQAVFGYIVSTSTMVPHDTPNIGFADDRVVISHVFEQLKAKVSADANQKGALLYDELKTEANQESTKNNIKSIDAFTGQTKNVTTKTTEEKKSEKDTPMKKGSKVITFFG